MLSPAFLAYHQLSEGVTLCLEDSPAASCCHPHLWRITSCLRESPSAWRTHPLRWGVTHCFGESSSTWISPPLLGEPLTPWESPVKCGSHLLAVEATHYTTCLSQSPAGCGSHQLPTGVTCFLWESFTSHQPPSSAVQRLVLA